MARTYQLIREQWLPRPINEAFAFFPARKIWKRSPHRGWVSISCGTDPKLHAGSLIEYKLRVRGLPMRWTSEIAVWEPPYRFVDNQLHEPYKLRHHEHTFASENGGTRIGDHVDYALLFGVLGQIAPTVMVRRDVENIFKFRQQRLEELLGAK